MRKQVFSLMALGLFMGSFMSMSPILEEDGKASDCVRESSAIVHSYAADVGEHPNDDLGFWLDVYMSLYEACLENS